MCHDFFFFFLGGRELKLLGREFPEKLKHKKGNQFTVIFFGSVEQKGDVCLVSVLTSRVVFKGCLTRFIDLVEMLSNVRSRK